MKRALSESKASDCAHAHDLTNYWEDMLVPDMHTAIAALLDPASLALLGMTSKSNAARFPMVRNNLGWVSGFKHGPDPRLVPILSSVGLLYYGHDRLVSPDELLKILSMMEFLTLPFATRLFPKFLELVPEPVVPMAYIAYYATPEILRLVREGNIHVNGWPDSNMRYEFNKVFEREEYNQWFLSKAACYDNTAVVELFLDNKRKRGVIPTDEWMCHLKAIAMDHNAIKILELLHAENPVWSSEMSRRCQELRFKQDIVLFLARHFHHLAITQLLSHAMHSCQCFNFKLVLDTMGVSETVCQQMLKTAFNDNRAGVCQQMLDYGTKPSLKLIEKALAERWPYSFECNQLICTTDHFEAAGLVVTADHILNMITIKSRPIVEALLQRASKQQRGIILTSNHFAQALEDRGMFELLLRFAEEHDTPLPTFSELMHILYLGFAHLFAKLK